MRTSRHEYPLWRIFCSILIAVGLLLSACSSAAKPPASPGEPAERGTTQPIVNRITVVPLRPFQTPIPSIAASTATRTATPLPAATATTTPDPRGLLASAQALLDDGDYTGAVAAFTNILAQPVPQSTGDDARFGLAQSWSQQEKYPEAIAAFQDFLRNAPKDSRVSAAQFLLGDAYRGAGQYAEAISAYRASLSGGDPALAPYVYERMGDSYATAGQRDQAIAAYQAGLNGAGASQAAGMREKIASAYLAGGDTASAVAQYQAILRTAQYSSYRARIEFLAGQALLNAGQKDAADAHFLTLVNWYPAADDTHAALVALLDDGVAVDDYQRGLVDYYAQAYEPAVEAFGRLLSRADSSQAADALYYSALSYEKLDNNDTAIQLLDRLIQDYPNSGHWGDAWLEKAGVLADEGQSAAALAVLYGLPSKAPQHPQAADALWQAAQVAASAGDYANALAAYRNLAAGYPGSEHAPDALFLAGLTAYQQGQKANAADNWQKLANSYSGQMRAAALLWLGKIALENHDTNTAATRFRQAAEADPGGYYSARAAELASGHTDSFISPAHIQYTSDDAAEQAQAEAWLASRLNLKSASGLGQLSSVLANEGHYRRGLALWRLGLRGEAEDEFDALRRDYSGDLASSYQLALAFRDLGMYRLSIQTAMSVLRLAGTTALQAPRFLGRLAYPTYYQSLVSTWANANHLDPLVVFSVIRQESLFDGFATSNAYAYGLMQVIPTTGSYIARRLGVENFDPSDLYRPTISIRFGTWYLAEQRNRFQGDIPAALAAYNAGPGRSAQWSAQSGGDPDLFYQIISLDEPRLYIERITEYYVVYKALYGDR